MHIQKRSHFKGYTVHFGSKSKPAAHDPGISATETGERTVLKNEIKTDEKAEIESADSAIIDSEPLSLAEKQPGKVPEKIESKKIPEAFSYPLKKYRSVESEDEEIPVNTDPDERIMHPVLATFLSLIALILCIIVFVLLTNLLLSMGGFILLIPLLVLFLVSHWMFLTLIMYSRKRTKFGSIRRRNAHYIFISAMVSILPFVAALAGILFLILFLSWPE